MSIEGLEKLDAWRKAKEFTLLIYREVIPLVPPVEKWAMVSQIRRSAQSIPANLAEGHGRFYYQENVRFCYIARGSLEETLTYLVLAQNLGYLPETVYRKILIAGDDLTRVINGYIAYLKKAKIGSNEPGNPAALREPLPDYILDSASDEQSQSTAE
jgi:four helix bundle protein